MRFESVQSQQKLHFPLLLTQDSFHGSAFVASPEAAGYCPRPGTSRPEKSNEKYPYLLRELTISRADQVWASDIAYVRMPRGWGV